MPEQFTIPQFIESEDKIFGPVTARQFIIVMVVGLVEFILFKAISFVIFLLIGIPFFALGMIFAFAKVNGQPFHYFMLNLIQTFKKPSLRVWDKTLTDSEIKFIIKKVEEIPPEAPKRKTRLGKSRLQELTLVVNTGGVYKPDEN